MRAAVGGRALAAGEADGRSRCFEKKTEADAPLSATFRYQVHALIRAVAACRRSVVMMVLVTISCTAWAQERVDVRSAYVEPAEAVYQLNATIDIELPDGARRAIRDGVPLTLDVEIVVHRSRNYWLDETVATLEQHYQLVYHALSERYLVRNLNSDQQASFATLDTAIDSLRVIANLPILDKALVLPDARHEISVRARVDVRTMPDALRFVLFWTDNWRQRSEWYTWSPQL
jgi:hypothetical protein